jgi:hypothetical protein
MTPPRRPHRKLFVVLLAVYLIWMAVLLVMYFKTVKPMRATTSQTIERER